MVGLIDQRFVKWLIISVLLSLQACDFGLDKNNSEKNIPKETVQSSLDRVLQNGRLEVITDYNSVDYFIYRGEPMGYQYEMLDQFCKTIGVKLHIRIENDLNKAFQKLKEGKADLIALGLTITKDRQRDFAFTEPLFITRQVLVQRLPDNWRRLQTRDELEAKMIRSSLELAGKTVYVQEGGVFKKRLETLADEIGDTIIIIEDKRDVEELIKAVSDGNIGLTAADEYMAQVLQKIYPDIDVQTPISFPQKLSWAVLREEKGGLLKEINHWLERFTISREGQQIYTKYFAGNRMSSARRSDFHSMGGKQLSPYDKEIKAVAAEIGWDWRLLASLIYQESEFKPDVVSWAGAFGLMQLMPVVMEEFGLDSTATPADQISAGGKFIQYLDLQIPETVSDPNERIKFILAAYNSGIGHVLDARRLAEKYKKNPDVWTDNVDFFVRNKSKQSFYRDPVVYYGYARGEETYNFVNEITERAEHYKNLLPK